jgi:hypothetical protein
MKKAFKMTGLALTYLLLGVSYSLMFIGSALMFISKMICYQDIGKK